jgi:hypothetical protein
MAKKHKKSRRGPARKSAAAPRGKPSSLASLSTEALAAELKRRQSLLPKLEKQAASLRAELDKVEAQIAVLRGGGAPIAAPAAAARASASAAKASTSSGAGRRTHRGQPTIGEQIVEILGARGGVLSPREIGDDLGRRLSREVNNNFLVQISLTLARLLKQGRVEKVGRGQYSAKGASVAANG